MTREEIINIITESQLNQIKSLDGIGKSEHFLKGPQLAGVTRDGQNIGWGNSTYKNVPVLQPLTDLENWSKVIAKYQPDIFIEMGVAKGGNVLYVNDLLADLGKKPIIYGVDIEDNLSSEPKELENFTFIQKSTLDLDLIETIKNLIELNKDKKVLIHFDDCHFSHHVLQELEIYSKIIKEGDIIIVGDTWDEGWYESPFKALCDFMSTDSSMTIDVDLHQEMVMPCNWIFGILQKK